MDSAYFWVGLRVGDDEWNKGTQVAEKVDFTNWEKVRFSQPDGHRITNDDCVALLGQNAYPSVFKPGHWVDYECDEKKAFICELRQESDAECPESWRKHNGVCYMVQYETKTYAEAEAYCASLQEGATLLTEFDYAELSQSRQISSLGTVWIGLRSTPDVDGVLRWRNADGTAVTQTNWLVVQYDEPYMMDINLPGQTCVIIPGTFSFEWHSPGSWGAVNCAFPIQYLCALKV